MGKKIKLGRLEDLRSKNSSSRKDDEEARFALRLGYKISQLRQKLGWSQAELARRIERKLHVVLRMERGDYRAFSLETLLRIAVATKTELVIGFRQPRS